MRRRREISEREPPQIRSSSFRGFDGVRRHVEPKDAIREKRVKFADPRIDRSQCISPRYISPSASPVQHERSGASVSNAPKTSEYAFFQKLKNNSGHDLSKRSNIKNKQLKILEPEESNNTCKNSFPDLSSSRLVEKARQNLFSSPPADASKNSEATDILRNGYEETRFPLVTEKSRQIKNIPLHLSPGGKIEDAGTTNLDGDIFSGKRKKLRQWAVQTTMHEVEGSCSDRCDLVSVLLNRLFPNSEESNSCREAKPMQTREDSSKLIDSSPESDALYNGSHSNQKRNFMEAANVKDTYKGSREIIHSKLDTEDFDSPLSTYSAKQIQYHDKTSSPAYQHNAANHGTFLIDFEQYGSATSYTQELNEFQGLDESNSGRRPSNLLLNWDVDNSDERSTSIFTSNETNLHTWTASEDNHHNSRGNRFDVGEPATSYIQDLNEFQVLEESNSGRRPSNLLLNWDVDNLDERSTSMFTSNERNLHTWTASADKYHNSVGNRFDVAELYPSSFFSSYSFRVSSFSLPYSSIPNSYDEERFVKEESSTAELEYIPLSLSYIPKYRSTWEDFTHRLCEDISIFSPENNRWLINKTISDKYRSDFGVLVPSEPEFGLKCLPASGSYDELHSATYDVLQPLQNDGPCLKLLTDGQEDFPDCSSNREIVTYLAGNADDCHEWSPVDFHKPLDMVVHCPLLLGSSSWLRSEEDTNFDDDQNKYLIRQ